MDFLFYGSLKNGYSIPFQQSLFSMMVKIELYPSSTLIPSAENHEKQFSFPSIIRLWNIQPRIICPAPDGILIYVHRTIEIHQVPSMDQLPCSWAILVYQFKLVCFFIFCLFSVTTFYLIS